MRGCENTNKFCLVKLMPCTVGSTFWSARGEASALVVGIIGAEIHQVLRGIVDVVHLQRKQHRAHHPMWLGLSHTIYCLGDLAYRLLVRLFMASLALFMDLGPVFFRSIILIVLAKDINM